MKNCFKSLVILENNTRLVAITLDRFFDEALVKTIKRIIQVRNVFWSLSPVSQVK
jgi:hypothetical protein